MPEQQAGMPRHCNVALFVPNAGCPHRCSFCNQRVISGAQTMPRPGDVRAACDRALETRRSPAGDSEIAFFGGSFTAIPRRAMLTLLETAAAYVRRGEFRGIRLSTRPDALDGEMLALLREYGVTAIELGAQSMDDRVLAANERGHTAAQVEQAARMIRAAGMELGLQMMTGLYESTPDSDRLTARRLADLCPATVRVYPTQVMEYTRLATLWRWGEYSPPTLSEAVELCADLLDFFERERGIPVIRMGLHANPSLEEGRLDGPWHPAFRELCESERYFRSALAVLRQTAPEGGSFVLTVWPRAVSPMVGQKRRNILRLEEQGYRVIVRENITLGPGDILVTSRDT